MQAAAQVQAAIELLDESITTGYPADRLMANYFRARRFIGSKDKAAISELFYTALRSRLSLEYLLELNELPMTPALLVAALLKLDGAHLRQTFTGERYQPKRLRHDSIDNVTVEQLDAAPEHVRLNVPAWIEPELKSSLGDRYLSEMAASQQRAATDVRVNTLKMQRSQLSAVIKRNGYLAHEGLLSPWALRFNQRVALFNLPEFKQGAFEVQDQGSQLLAWVTGAKAGDKVVDFCAGAGGKSLALAAMMENKGVLYACDVHSKRLAELEKRAKRAGAHNIRTHVLSSEQDKWVKKHQAIADVVLVDAPCTGTGTWRRSPDSRWNLSADKLSNLQALQASILSNASRLVKPGGRLIYATCSLLESENEQQIAQFLSNNAEFSRLSLTLPQGLDGQAENSEMRLFSAVHETDGFFAACLQRVQS